MYARLAVVGSLLLLGACTRTVVVAPAPQAQARGPARTLGIPPGHLPRVGQCRVWIPGRPPGQQPSPRSRSCAGIRADAPAGSWIVYRPSRDRRVVHVREVDAVRVGVILFLRVYDADSGRHLRDANSDDEEIEGERDDRRGRGRRDRP